eukprot:jgi/Tetstr1/448473/TSEL_035741.t1
MAAAKEMRHWNPEAHIGDNECILAGVKAAVAEATAGKADEQEMRRVERINREGWDYPHLRSGDRFPIEFFSLTTKSTSFMVGNLAQIVRHFGFSETAANKIASALDMLPTKVFSHTDASGVRKLSMRALPDPVNEHAYADRKPALQDSNGSRGAWPEASWQHAVESVLFVERPSKTLKHCGYSICSVRQWRNDNEMRCGIQHIKNQRFTKSTNSYQPCRAGSLPPTVLADDRYYQVVAAPRRAGGSSKPASQPPPAGSGGDGSQNGAATGFLELRAAPPPSPEQAWSLGEYQAAE